MANVILDKNDNIAAPFSGTYYGSTGSETVKITSDTISVKTDANVERVEFLHASTDYTYKATATGVQVFYKGNLSADLQSGEKLAFTDGSAVIASTFDAVTGAAFTLGGATVSATAGAVKPTLSTAAGEASTIGGAVTPPVTTSVQTLKTTQDALTSTGGTSFVAHIFDNQNTLQSGDSIIATGTNTLQADIGNSQKFAITPETTGVQTVSIRAEAVSADSSDNNLSKTNRVQLDAERMVGVNFWNDDDSRADLQIEDYRILPGQITKDITIGMLNTDPGHVDFGFYFDQPSLRSSTNANSTLILEVADTRALLPGGSGLPLDTVPYVGVRFWLNGKEVDVDFTNQGKVAVPKTYAGLVDVIKANLAAQVTANADLANVNVSLGASVPRADTQSGQTVTISQIVLTYQSNSNTTAFDIKPPNGAPTNDWISLTPVPASSGYHTAIATTGVLSNELITSKIVLDNVGRGNMGGDLVVGGMSVGDTDNCTGVQKFQITVEHNSALQTINSTNNWLQEVTIQNGTYVDANNKGGNLIVTGEVTAPYTTTANPTSGTGSNNTSSPAGSGPYGVDTALPGTETVVKADGHGGDQHNTYGFNDVRIIDASAMTGKLTFNALISEQVIPKYANPLTNINGTNASIDGTTAGDTNIRTADNAGIAFAYTGGSNDDKIMVDIDASAAASRSKIVTGREDFTFNVSGGAGNDQITVKLVNSGNTGRYENWYNNQDLNNNITIDGGAGNDTIRTPGAGDKKIFGGTGDDVIYTDNTGKQVIAINGAQGYLGVDSANPGTAAVNATYVFNTADQVTPLAAARNINDIRSDANDLYNIYRGTLTVNFKGLANTVTINSTDYRTSDMQINQALKTAINTDPILNKLLVAQDGPANTVVVTSLIDGALTGADLTLAFGRPTLGTLNTTEIAGINAKWYPVNTNATEAIILADMYKAADASHVDFFTKGDYTSAGTIAGTLGTTALANDKVNNITGAPSVSTSDNLINPGADNDIVVLSTTVGPDFATSSNEVVKFDPAFSTTKDVIVNFNAGNNVATQFGIDHLDFTTLGGGDTTAAFNAVRFTSNVAAVTANLADKSITISPLTLNQNDSEGAVANLYFGNANVATTTHVYVSVNSHNVGTVYTINDAPGINTAVAVKQGQIDLSDTSWFSLSNANFVDTTTVLNANGTDPHTVYDANNVVPGYYNHQSEGPTTINAGGGIAPPVGPTYAVTAAAATVNEGANAVFNVVTTGVAANTVLPYTLTGQINAADVTGGLTGTVTIDATGKGVITIPVVADLTTEGTETMIVTLDGKGATAQTSVLDTSTTPVGPVPVAVAVAAANAAPYDATAGNVTFTVAAGNYTYTINGFGAGDVLKFPAGNPASVSNNDFTDGIVDVTYAAAGQVVTVHLTGIPAAKDMLLNSVADFNTVFGAGTIA